MDTVIRVAVIYVFIMVALRLLGKREFGQLSSFDLVILLLIPELVSQSLTREDYSLTNAIVAVSALMILVFLTSLLSHMSPAFSKVINGEPTVLVQKGRMVEESMNRERVNPDEVLDAMHAAGLERIEQVKWAILGADGRISVVPWQPGDTRPQKKKKSGVP